MRAVKKYWAILKTQLLNSLAYPGDLASRSLSIVLFMWVFVHFQQVRGWGLSEMFLVFGIVAAGFGLGTYLSGNVLTLADVIVSGRLDYYLSLPRPALLHALASRSRVSGLGDFCYGFISFALAGGTVRRTPSRALCWGCCWPRPSLLLFSSWCKACPSGWGVPPR